MYGLKPVPLNVLTFSACCEVVPFQSKDSIVDSLSGLGLRAGFSGGYFVFEPVCDTAEGAFYSFGGEAGGGETGNFLGCVSLTIIKPEQGSIPFGNDFGSGTKLLVELGEEGGLLHLRGRKGSVL